MINIQNIASGSAGNCYIISDSKTNLMIECGVSPIYLKKRCDIALSEIDGALISHCHDDHAKYTQKYMDKGVDCFASKKTIEQIGCDGHRLNELPDNYDTTLIGTFLISQFRLSHDVKGHRGFYIKSKEGSILYITDTPICNYKFPPISHIMIECNYKRSLMNKNKKYPNFLKQRIIKNHMELETTKNFLKRTVSKITTEIHLIHMSKDNSDKELFKREIMELTGKQVFI